jgi:DNA (cytosine-5)-methyltransferase 1
LSGSHCSFSHTGFEETPYKSIDLLNWEVKAKMKKLSVGGFFAGCGGLDYGFQNAGFSLKWANEIEENFASSYKSLTHHNCHVGDFWEVADDLPGVDVIVGGPPCQSFSLVGKRLDDDPRGKLVGGFFQLIANRMPKAFLMENVAGLAASKYDGKRLPEYLNEEFQKLGYKTLVQRVDASDFFVPQRRKRLIIMGVLSPRSDLELISQERFALKIKERTGILLPLRKVTAIEALADLPSPIILKDGLVDYRQSPVSAYAEIMRLQAHESVSLQTMPTMSKLDKEFVKHIPQGGNYQDIPDSISTTRIMKFKASGGRTTTYGRLHEDQPAYTINTYFNRPNVGANYHYNENRLITVREAMRLQSFPDSFTPTYKSQRELHIQIGNAVPPLLAEALALSLKESIAG